MVYHGMCTASSEAWTETGHCCGSAQQPVRTAASPTCVQIVVVVVVVTPYMA